MLEVACPIPEGVQAKLPWTHFVSVSNNGVDKSKEFKVMVYHSKCSACQKSGKCVKNVHKVRNGGERDCV